MYVLENVCTLVCSWNCACVESEDNFEEPVPSFHIYVGSGDQTQVNRLIRQASDPLRPLADPHFCFLFVVAVVVVCGVCVCVVL